MPLLKVHLEWRHFSRIRGCGQKRIMLRRRPPRASERSEPTASCRPFLPSLFCMQGLRFPPSPALPDSSSNGLSRALPDSPQLYRTLSSTTGFSPALPDSDASHKLQPVSECTAEAPSTRVEHFAPHLRVGPQDRANCSTTQLLAARVSVQRIDGAGPWRLQIHHVGIEFSKLTHTTHTCQCFRLTASARAP